MAAEKAEIDALKKECDGLRAQIEVSNKRNIKLPNYKGEIHSIPTPTRTITIYLPILSPSLLLQVLVDSGRQLEIA